MAYEIDRDLAEKGIKELEKIAFNRLESALESGYSGEIKYAVDKALETKNVANSLSMGANLISDYFLENGRAITARFGIDIPGYTTK